MSNQKANNQDEIKSGDGQLSIKEQFKKHQEAKKAELEKFKKKKIEAELKGHGRAFKIGASFDGL